MPEKIVHHLSGVSETCLITLYARALESVRPDGLIHDDKAVEMVRRLDCDFSRYRLQGHDEISLILRMRTIDRMTREFLALDAGGVVIHLGCGLDTRFNRVDNGRVEWYDLDLPDVIDLRKRLSDASEPRYHLLSGSAFDATWMGAILPLRPRPMLFIAEGVLPYFEEAQVKALVLKLQSCFPGAELVCDAHTPFVIWADNLQLTFDRIHAKMRWSLKHGKDLEGWDPHGGIKLLEEWFYFNQPEPRLETVQWMRRIPQLRESTGIFHYRLGPPA